jgi:ADP-ribose pyrophosphatase YjhB (NUDIX family)
MFNESNVPKGGTCLSAFLVLKGKAGILVGKMAKPEIWVERFLVGEAFAPRYVSSNKLVLPATHLKYGEKPEDAAKRVLLEQIGAGNVKLTLLQIQSHLSQDPNDPEAAHWDVCFVYAGRLRGKQLQRPEWFSELIFQRPSHLKSEDFTRGHGDILTELGIVKE